MTQADPALERARKHVEEVRDFWYHLMTYVFVSALLVVIDLLNGTDGPFLGLDFAFWVIFGWGIGVAGHAISVFFGDYRVQKLYEQEKSRHAE
jgi:Na+/citrate or Na+/malate symporter